MDKVVQQNVANAEASASASEEMNAQAEQLKEYVRELMVLITGSREPPASCHLSNNCHGQTALGTWVCP